MSGIDCTPIFIAPQSTVEVVVDELIGSECSAVRNVVSLWLARGRKLEAWLAAHAVDEKDFDYCAGICEQCRNSCQVEVMAVTDQEYPQARRAV
jgi:hypothetical protein